mgnify:CR=1 FL=1
MTYLHLWSSLDWICSITMATYSSTMFLWIGNLEFKRLSFRWWPNQGTLKHEWGSNNCFRHISKTWCRFIDNNLNTLKWTAIIQLNETKFFLSPCAPSPPCKPDCLTNEFFMTFKQTSDPDSLTIWHWCHWFSWYRVISC